MDGYKLKISPGQGLLLLMEIYKDEQETVTLLKKLYLSGAKNTKYKNDIQKFLTDSKLSAYQISFDKEIINEDPTRRYFETHLAYESLVYGLNQIKIDDLKDYAQNLYAMVPDTQDTDEIDDVLNGYFSSSDSHLYKEYAYYLKSLRGDDIKIFSDLTDEQREKIQILVLSSFLSLMNTAYVDLPIDIYGEGIYSETQKGKVLKLDQELMGSLNRGILKSHMPLAQDDIARHDDELPYLKPSEQANYVEGSTWVEHNFQQWVHPFSNSISGTMLCQLRNMAQMRNDGNDVFTQPVEKMNLFLKLYISAMLFNSGGHSLYEFIAPLGLPEVQAEFSSIKGFNGINLESMYLIDNVEAFDAALKNTIRYHNMLLLKKALHSELQLLVQFPQKTLSDLQVISDKMVDLFSDERNIEMNISHKI
ncbi:MAG: hypothetical protein QG556_105 [Pseudomonadota bacterium]|nr:hypothetical protein [Pseudomonadota bacterium]